jgi:hypothetical protein
VVVRLQRRSILIVLLAVLLLHAAHALSYSLNVNPIQNDIDRNQSATYEVVISNFESVEVDFQIYSIDPAWNVKVEPLDLSVPSNTQRTFSLSLRPTSSANFGTQGVTVNFKELNSGTLVKKTVVLSLRNPDAVPQTYSPTVSLDVAMPYDVDPRSPIPLRLELHNSNSLNISNLTILVSSPHFSSASVIKLAPLSVHTEDIAGLHTEPTTPPGEAEVSIKLLYQGKVINQIVKNYKIKEYTQVQQHVNESKHFFKTDKTIEIRNDGNVRNVATVSVATSFVKSLFISSSLPYENGASNGQRVIFWSIPLEPGETRSIVYTENYRILVLLFLLAIICIAAYLLMRSPLVAVKEAVAVAHSDGVSNIKVRVFVKNRSAKAMQHIQVTDKVPSLVDVLKTESPGSLAPSKIAVSEKQGTLLRWELDELEPFEERILTYQVKSKLKIIGRMKLPNARIRFTYKNKERAVYSNNIELVEKFKDK